MLSDALNIIGFSIRPIYIYIYICVIFNITLTNFGHYIFKRDENKRVHFSASSGAFSEAPSPAEVGPTRLALSRERARCAR